MTATSRHLVIATSFSLVLLLAIGLAAGALDTPARLYPGSAGRLASPAVVLPAVLIAGLADGVNPCAFTVLLLFIATIVSMYRGAGQERFYARLLLLGGTFILAIFITYLVLGTGLLRASAVLTQNHAGARLGALAAVLLGLWMMKDYFVPGWGPQLRAPAVTGNLVRTWAQRASFTAMFGLGALVAVCTVPCSGAMYLAILSILAVQQSFAQAYLYLVLYNLMFITPLLAILLGASIRPIRDRLGLWNLRRREYVRLVLGGGVAALGLAILATV